MHRIARDDMARHVEFFQQFLHGRDFVGFFVDVDMRQYQRRVDGERAEHLFCLGVVEAIETMSALPSNAITRAPGPAASTFRWAACSRKAISTSAAVSPCKIYRMAVCAGGLFQLILKALFSFRRWTLMKVRMPRYELAPLTIAKMENNRTCGS